MSTQQAAPRQGARTNLVLATLFLGTFVLGCAELLVVGVLNLIATDLAVSLPAAGAMVTAYALVLAIGGPLLTALTMKLDRKSVLVVSIAIFIVAILAQVFIPSYGVFMAARVIAGAMQGLFIAMAFVTAMSIVSEERKGWAISMVISGVTVSAAFGVPLGTLVGQGLGWRGPFVVIAALAVVALVATIGLVPSVPGSGGIVGQVKYAFAPRVLAVLGLNAVVFASLYSALTYIVPFLQNVTGIAGATVSVFLFAYGAATAVGSLTGGRFADKNAGRTLIVGTAGTAVSLLALYFVGASPVLVAVVMLVWGLFAFGMVPSLQLRVVSLAGPGGELANSLPGSAINVGVAVGPIVGGVALSSYGASAPVFTGMIIAVLGIGVALATSFLKPPVVEEAQAAVEADEPMPKAA